MALCASVFEANFDCLVGPTHHFGGLSLGNIASKKHEGMRSSPRRAALQCLDKMYHLMRRGFHQGVLPPHERPHIPSFKNLGFSGPDHLIIKKAYETMPEVCLGLCSSAAMWAANAATVSPSIDSSDGIFHISPSNLITMFHRHLEHHQTKKIMERIFLDKERFIIHDALLAHDLLADEGAANHNRLCPTHAHAGLNIFVYGRESHPNTSKTKVFKARQSKLSVQAIALRHGLVDEHVLWIEQNPHAIDQGAFHNDVVCVVNENVMLIHELAFFDQSSALSSIEDRYRRLYHREPIIIQASKQELSIKEAVSCYLFNSQLLSKPSGGMLLLAPIDCQKSVPAQAFIRDVLDGDNPIDEIAYIDVSESMRNGGGPACLRLRLVLNEEEFRGIKDSIWLTEELYHRLRGIVERYYVDDLSMEQLWDEGFLKDTKSALDEISRALGLPEIYDFQF